MKMSRALKPFHPLHVLGQFKAVAARSKCLKASATQSLFPRLQRSTNYVLPTTVLTSPQQGRSAFQRPTGPLLHVVLSGCRFARPEIPSEQPHLSALLSHFETGMTKAPGSKFEARAPLPWWAWRARLAALVSRASGFMCH